MKNKLIIALAVGLAGFTASQATAQTCRAPQPSLCLRSCWNAKSPCGSPTQMSALNRAVVHHTASSSDYATAGINESKGNVRGVQNYHMDVNGWCDIGYHFLADKHGNMFSGRSNSVDDRPQGAHDGCNSQSFGFTALGYYHPPHNNAATDALVNALEKLIAWRMPGGWNPTGGGSSYCGGGTDKIMGHRQVKATACPGDKLYSKIKDGNGFENAVKARRSCN
jgi:hypothetical protein